MAYATTSTGHVTLTKGSDVRVIRTEVLLGSLINVIQTTVSENEQYRGLDEATAKMLASAYDETTNPNGLVKTSLGGIRVTVSSGAASGWFSVFGCRGTIEVATARREGDSTMWTVDYQKETMSCTADGGTVTNI